MVENVLKDVKNTYDDETIKLMIKEVLNNIYLDNMVKKNGKKRKNVIEYVDFFIRRKDSYFMHNQKENKREFMWRKERGRQMLTNFKKEECVDEDLYSIILNLSDNKPESFAFYYGKIIEDINKKINGEEVKNIYGIDYSDINTNDLDEELSYYYADYDGGDRKDNVTITVKGKELEAQLKIIEKVNEVLESERDSYNPRNIAKLYKLPSFIPTYKDTNIGVVAEANNTSLDWLADKADTIQRAVVKTVCESEDLRKKYDEYDEKDKFDLFDCCQIDTMNRFINKKPTKKEYEEMCKDMHHLKEMVLLQDIDRKELESYIHFWDLVIFNKIVGEDEANLKEELSEKYLEDILENYKEINEINGFSKDGLFKKEVQEKIDRIKTEDDIEI